MATVPLRVCNRLGIPMLEVQSVVQGTTPSTVTTFYFNNHPQRNINFYGAFFVKVPQNTATLTQTNTVEFATSGVSGSNLPLYLYDGMQATVDDVLTTGNGIMLCFYDKVDNRLHLVNAF